ncbi:hypothetical protein STCU_10969 [Strigomonas culicis]|uniref:Uncharacterized protein n=1 Tax=Strigomonas culicis TaxID=28005 RepID=S9TIX9_9TRYP|nr:hypothetical protein STCU_10969 [Strigomonas culicis]|eukprot:EPY16839.1 hypothetical protein STCU_10969 [Strigomonas culicis]
MYYVAAAPGQQNQVPSISMPSLMALSPTDHSHTSVASVSGSSASMLFTSMPVHVQTATTPYILAPAGHSSNSQSSLNHLGSDTTMKGPGSTSYPSTPSMIPPENARDRVRDTDGRIN